VAWARVAGRATHVTAAVLLVGGGRFVGRRLLLALLDCGYQVDVLNRGLARASDDLPPGARHLRADREDAFAMRDAIGGRSYSAVFDTSGYRPRHVRTVLGSVTAERYVYISSCMVYSALAPVAATADVPEVGPLSEDDETVAPCENEDGDLAVYYASYKRGCELALLAQDRVPAIVLRPCGIYGAGDYWYRHDYFFDRLVRGRPVLIPDSHYGRKVHLTSVDGLTTVCLLAAQRPARGHQVLNVVDADAATCAELTELCAQAAGVSSAVRGYPAAMASTAVPHARDRARFPFGPEPGFSLSGTRAARALDWHGTSLREGTSALFADFERRRTAGLVGKPDFTLDDALLRMLRASPGPGGKPR
jgi:nucleoside-diphosphate-sugar epimerase